MSVGSAVGSAVGTSDFFQLSIENVVDYTVEQAFNYLRKLLSGATNFVIKLYFIVSTEKVVRKKQLTRYEFELQLRRKRKPSQEKLKNTILILRLKKNLTTHLFSFRH